MGNKKGCSCGFWNGAQQECLYSGYGCFHEKKKLEVTKEWIDKKKIKMIEVVLTGGNIRAFLRSLYKEIQGK